MKITEKEEREVLANYGIISKKKLAKRLGIGRDRLLKIAKLLNIWAAPISNKDICAYIDIEELEIEYKSKTKQQCADLFGVSFAQITYLLKTNNIFKDKRVTYKPGMFNKPKGWNPLTNSVLKEKEND